MIVNLNSPNNFDVRRPLHVNGDSKRSARQQWVPLVVAALMIACSGCHRFRSCLGPQTITQDRIPYNNAVAHSWKEQTLLNIVKLRYAEPPFFIDVPQIVGGYSLDKRVNGTVGLQNASQPGIPSGERVLGTLGADAAYSDRPTITYSPQTNSEFIRNLTAPLPPDAVLSLLESGYAVDAVLGLSIQSINGLRNKSAFGGTFRPADPEFLRVIQLLRQAQLSGDFGIRTEVSTESSKPEKSLFIQFAETVDDPELDENISILKQALGLNSAVNRFSVIFGDAPEEENQIAIKTRPIYLIMRDLTPFVDVPEQHLACGFAMPFDTSGVQFRPLHVRCGCEPPPETFTCVCYRDCWFWIEHGQLESKRTFNYLLLLLALADTAPKQPKPTVTIQAN